MKTVMTLGALADAYLKKLKEEGKNKITLYTYGKDIEQILAFFGADRPLDSISKIHVGKFLKSDELLKKANGEDRAEQTINKTIRVFRMMMVWALEEGQIEALPMPKTISLGHNKINSNTEA